MINNNILARCLAVALLALSLSGLATFTAPAALAQLRLDITRGRVDPMPVAVSRFTGNQPRENQIGQDVTNVVSADLERSGLFRPIDPKSFIQQPDALRNQLPRFGDWRQIGAQALIHGLAEIQPDGRLSVQFRLWDVFGESQMAGQVYTTGTENWRRVAHIVADAIYKRITGEDGYFNTQIVYISESGPQQRRTTRLAIMDQDSANHQFLTDGRALTLSPRFSPTAREITYMSYINNKPRVYLYNIDRGQQEVLGDFPGMTFAPRFSPDGNRVIMSVSRPNDGNSEIQSMDLRTRRVEKLTSGAAIDTSPSYAPDGARIVFNSDRGGSQQLYTMTSSGGEVKRISFGTGKYATPVWSPRGDLIAFTKITEGEFFIGVMRPDGSSERVLTKGFDVEAPTWAPNGRYLMYFKKTATDSRGGGGVSRLYSIDLTGFNEREISTPADGSDPAWSALLP